VPHAPTNGIVTYYEDTGEGTAVVLIHGYGADLRLWDQQMPALVDAGFRSLRYDVRGHGRSLIAPDGYTYENYSTDLRDLLDNITTERPATQAHIVGLSMGGGIALQFALDFPERVLSLTLVDSALPGLTYSEETTAPIEALVDAVRAQGAHSALDSLWLNHPFFDGVRRVPGQFERVRKIVLDFEAPDMREGARPPDYQPDLVSRLPEVTAPALIVVGENDIADFRLAADILAENLARARLAVITDCWHLPPVEKPDEFNDLLIDFLRDPRL
jgi:pimeloyl-ACP methyl ester carboxylesterase